MNLKNMLFCTLLITLFSLLTIITTFNNKKIADASSLYEVYLNGNKIGKIENKDELYNLIDSSQQNLKDKYNVKKVYPPKTLKVKKVNTYDYDVKESSEVYNEIKKNDAFTINGYQIIIKKEVSNNTSDDIGEDLKKEEKKYENIIINVLDKKVFTDAIEKFVKAFLGNDRYNSYKNGTQQEIIETGSILENVYFQESIKIKEALINTNDIIYTDSDTLSQYLLYGLNQNNTEYVVNPGDTVETVAYNNKLNVEEFLIANPKITSVKNILSPGQVVNVSLINPIIHLIYEEEVVEDLETDFEQKTEYDNSKKASYKEITQVGVKGLNRVTEKIKISNGETQNVVITNKVVLKSPVTQITTVGGKKASASIYSGPVYGSAGSWSWPTRTPYVLSSPFGYRWGKLHEGFDISGCGFGSPIYAANNGVVRSAGYGGMVGSKAGYNVVIEHPNGIWSVYAHLSSVSVSAGANVSSGQQIGAMGKSGFATGTHLHFALYNGTPYRGGRPINPGNFYK